jgi:archaemetzincin
MTDDLTETIKKLKPLFGPMVEQFRGDWRSTKEGQQDERGERNERIEPQTFEQFKKRCYPQAKNGDKIGLLSLGELPARISLKELTELIQAYFCMPCEKLPEFKLNQIPKRAWRSLGEFVPQMDANYVLEEVLFPEFKTQDRQHYSLVALTNEDLFCEMIDPLHYVYGLSHKPNRGDTGVAIVSTRRVWKPDAVGFHLSLLRLLKLLTHEICHQFNLPHCRMHACNMNGLETVDELDRHPLELCPECLAKVCLILKGDKGDPAAHYEGLVPVYKRLGLNAEATRCEQCRDML